MFFSNEIVDISIPFSYYCVSLHPCGSPAHIQCAIFLKRVQLINISTPVSYYCASLHLWGPPKTHTVCNFLETRAACKSFCVLYVGVPRQFLEAPRASFSCVCQGFRKLLKGHKNPQVCISYVFSFAKVSRFHCIQFFDVLWKDLERIQGAQICSLYMLA